MNKKLEVEVITGPDTSRLVTEMLLEFIDKYKDELTAKIKEDDLKKIK
ncbi:hypothetical protein [Clostridium sp. UBA1056]